ncbi:hypothetical protein CWO00_01515 [Vibrio splendidus]|nr:hypothetical protein CWO00_01515 [Vibrio splendidus]
MNKNECKELANNFSCLITHKEHKKNIFQHISDEDFENIKKAFTAETRIRNEKRYYRFENSLTNEVEWCVESKLGTYLKSNSFKKQLKLLGRNKRANRNSHQEIYFIQNAKKPYKTSEELEYMFSNDLEHGKLAQSHVLKDLGERPTKLARLQS